MIFFYVVTGISLRWIATAAAAGPSSIVIWIGALFAFYLPLTLSVTELTSRYPHEGGLYVWTKHAFGDFSGFMCAWMYWTCNLPYFPSVLYFAAANALYIGGNRWLGLANQPVFFMVFATLAMLLITIVHVVGLNVGKWLNNIGAIGMCVPIAIVIGMGLTAWWRFGSATQFTRAAMVPTTRLADVVFWSILTFAMAGSETASFMAEEIKDPRRTMPRALLVAGLFVTIGYVGGTICVLLAVPSGHLNGLQAIMEAIIITAQRVGWPGVVAFTALLITLSNLGAAGAYLASCARLPFVAGIDRYLPALFGRLHPRWGTPYVSVLTMTAFALVFIILGQAGTNVKGAYDVMVSLGVITYFIPFQYLFATMILVQREPAGPGVFRVPGGKPVAIALGIIGFITSTAAIIISVVPAADEANKALAVFKIVGLTAALLAVGAILFAVRNPHVKGGAPQSRD
jgi:glutamate:GABA antiporter